MVFADTLYWVAIIRPGDQWERPATEARRQLGNVILLTTDEILTEFLSALSKGGATLRRQAVKMVQAILANPNVKVLPQTRYSFLNGLRLYGKRYDKTYSLTDCISMYAMRSEAVTDVLTNDQHFEQEGFNILIESD